MPFTSDPSTHRQCFNVTIVDDDIVENLEDFFLNLTLAESTVPVRVDPDTTMIEIDDRDDGKFRISSSLVTSYAFNHQFQLFLLDLWTPLHPWMKVLAHSCCVSAFSRTFSSCQQILSSLWISFLLKILQVQQYG